MARVAKLPEVLPNITSFQSLNELVFADFSRSERAKETGFYSFHAQLTIKLKEYDQAYRKQKL